MVVAIFQIIEQHIWKGQSHCVELDLEVIPLKVIKHTLFYIKHTYIYIAISKLTDMDTDKDGCVHAHTHVHMRVCIYIFIFSSSAGGEGLEAITPW